MKKHYLLICILLIALTAAGCGKKEDIAFITDMGTVNDGSFNQGTYEGVVKYCEDNNKTNKVYEPSGVTDEAYLKSIKEAVKDGADMIVCAGVLFENAMYKAQKKYPNVNFMIIDGQPVDENGERAIEDNTLAVMFSEEQAGFLAGYSAVREGYLKLGFIGGTDQDTIVRFGYGFVQGADYAAIEKGVNVEVKYCYANTFMESSDVKNMAAAWYTSGTEVIFPCGGAMGRSVISAAEENGGKIIGVDIDQSKDSETVITSARKDLGNAVYKGLSEYYSGSFPGGTVMNMDASNDGICLEMENSRFEVFDDSIYQPIYELLKSGRIIPYASTAYGNTSDLELISTEVFYLELK